MTHVPNGLFSNPSDEKLARDIFRKLAMNIHDKSNPATLAMIKGYFAMNHSDSKYNRVLSKLLTSSAPLKGSIQDDEFYVGAKVMRDPFFGI